MSRGHHWPRRVRFLGLAVLLLAGAAGSAAGDGRPAGDTCLNPVTLLLPAMLPVALSDTTCGHTDDYDDTCLAEQDSGEDVVYELVLGQDLNLHVELAGADNGGLAISTTCPPAACLYAIRGNASVALDAELSAGTYYLMVDSAAECTAYTLILEQLPPPGPGDSCATPFDVHLPADLPFHVAAQSTCGRHNYCSDPLGCTAGYNGGEDAVYQLLVVSPIDVHVSMQPNGAAWTSVLIDDTCPPAGECVAFMANAAAAPRELDAHLEAGIYTLVVDCAPALGCLNNFALDITALPLGACCAGQQCLGTMTSIACYALSAQWYEALDCATFRCPVPLEGPRPETCGTAYELPEAPYSVSVNNFNASHDGPPSSCNAVPPPSAMRNDVWYRYTAASSGPLGVHVQYPYNGLTAIYEGAACDQLTEIACLNATTGAGWDRTTLDVQAGTTYWFQVGKYGSNTGGGVTLLALTGPTARCAGDTNCDGSVGFADIDYFVAAIPNNQAAWAARFWPAPTCPFGNCDVNGDGNVGFEDIYPFVALIPSPCP